MHVSLPDILGTPTHDALPRRVADFDTLVDALNYAATGERGLNFFSARGELAVSMPYRDLRDRAETFGRRLVDYGLAKGERVALIAETSADFVVAFMGCQYASVLPVPLPLPTSFGGREGYVGQLRQQVTSCGARLVIGPDAMVGLMEDAARDLDVAFTGAMAQFEAQTSADAALRLPSPDDLAYLQYSSGSTRFPHGIAVTHRSLMANCAGIGQDGVKLREGDRNVSWLPFYHDMGLVGSLLTPVAAQVSADYMATEDFARRPLQWLKLITRNRGTISYSPSFGYDLCARRLGDRGVDDMDLSCWRVAGIGGDMIPPDVIRGFCTTFAGAGFEPTTFVPSYGLAECTLAVSFAPLGRGIEVDEVEERILTGEGYSDQTLTGAHSPANGHAAHQNGHQNGHGALNGHMGSHNGHNGAHGPKRTREVVNCGRPLPQYELEIRDDRGRALTERAIGRVFVRGPSVMREYFNDAEGTRRVLSADGWLDTGDMGYLLDGCLYVIGRVKDMIIVNGRNHWPQDIEWAAEQVDGIRAGDIAAISVPGANAEEVPTVLVQCRLRDKAARAEFAREVRQQILGATGIACSIELIPPRTLPRTSSGKLSRSKARAQYLAGGLSALAS
ncbi:AMP-binding protein [Rhodothalassium salexigens]|uniref:AMP-binding protein n=1 Tax=Rhodothalassium salexigens TaxID=1086 RepID=UPI00191495FD|nr:AMP-binding protein [Rhodothalassium salexigens]